MGKNDKDIKQKKSDSIIEEILFSIINVLFGNVSSRVGFAIILIAIGIAFAFSLKTEDGEYYNYIIGLICCVIGLLLIRSKIIELRKKNE